MRHNFRASLCLFLRQPGLMFPRFEKEAVSGFNGKDNFTAGQAHCPVRMQTDPATSRIFY
jgi:hypothetical protein